MTRKVNRYFISIPIVDIHEAKILGSDTNWNIIDVLRDTGAEGLSAEQISKEIKVPIHSIYGDLKQLQAAGLIEGTIKRPAWGRPPKKIKQRSGGKPTKIYTENIPWGYSQLCLKFEESLNLSLKQMEQDIDELGKKWFSILEKIVSKYQTDDLEKFFPQDTIHEECGFSHEATEFLHAISLFILWKIFESKDYDELARKHKFMK